MVVDEYGGKFHQYDLSVDGLSYFSMPAMYELGTEKMWRKIDKWGMMRQESRASGDNCTSSSGDEQDAQLRDAYTKNMSEMYNRWNEVHDTGNGQKQRTGRLVDEYHFDKANQRSHSYDGKSSRSISRGEFDAMNPRNETEEDRMIRIAMEASMRDLDRNNYVSSSKNTNQHMSSIRQVKSEQNTHRLAVVGEDENLIDFGEDSINDLSKGVSQIAFSQERSSDVSVLSVLGDDDATVASFMVPMQQPSGFGGQRPLYPPVNQPYQQHVPVQPTFQDPTFNASFASTPRAAPFNDAASFAYAPPPTWDDYKNAFGGSVRMDMTSSVMGGSTVMSNSMMSPVSVSSPMNASVSSVPQQQYQQQLYNGYAGGAYHANPFVNQPNQPQVQVATNTGKNSMFDPLRSDPFTS
jgi:hypothetical protein